MLARLVPGPLVRWFARPYVAGDSIESGLSTADGLAKDHEVLTTLDLLGEDVSRTEQVEANIRTYRLLVDTLAEDGRFATARARPSISLKPSAFTTSSHDAAREPIEALAEHAHARGVALTIDMEDRHWTDLTLDLSVGLFERGYDVGTVLQTRLNRTQADLDKIPAGMRLRLVIGIYPEPSDVAIASKREMKQRMVAYADRLIDRGAFVEYATHDVPACEKFVREVAPKAPERCEVQMLLGVPRAEFRRKLFAGAFGPKLPMRLYVPFALGWDDATAYLRRRMAESPSMAWLVFRNFFARRANR